MPRFITHYRKLIAALVGATAQAIQLGLLSETASGWATVAIGLATALGVYAIPNEQPEPEPEPEPVYEEFDVDDDEY